jgi:hypothetical protein
MQRTQVVDWYISMQICLCPILFSDIVAIPVPSTKLNLYVKMVSGIERLRSSGLFFHVDGSYRHYKKRSAFMFRV